MAHRINERNTGHTALDMNPKVRASKGVTLKGEMKDNAAAILQKVYDAMERDELMDGDFTDGGRFVLMLDRHEMAILQETIEKLKTC